jgi:hypothetical protein
MEMAMVDFDMIAVVVNTFSLMADQATGLEQG